MQKASFVAIGLAFVLIIGAVIYMGTNWNDHPVVPAKAPENATETVLPEPQPDVVEAAEPVPSTVDFDVLETNEEGITLMPNATQVADELNDPESDPEMDLSIVSELVESYIQIFGRIPGGGENDEITEYLLGQNEKSLAFLPPKHRVINGKGEIIDRWGTPYYFHPISSKHLEVRSAGPDGAYYTEDDVVLPSEPSDIKL